MPNILRSLILSLFLSLITRCHATQQYLLTKDEGYLCGRVFYSYNHLVQVADYISAEKYSFTGSYPKIFRESETGNFVLAEAQMLWPLSEDGIKIWKDGEPTNNFVVMGFDSHIITNVMSQEGPHKPFQSCEKIYQSTFQGSLTPQHEIPQHVEVFQCGTRQIERAVAEKCTKNTPLAIFNKAMTAKIYVYDMLRQFGIQYNSFPLYMYPVSTLGSFRHDGKIALLIEVEKGDKEIQKLVWVMFKKKEMWIPCRLTSQSVSYPVLESVE